MDVITKNISNVYSPGTYKVGNETKRNQRNKTKPTKAKRNQRKQNEIDWYEKKNKKKR